MSKTEEEKIYDNIPRIGIPDVLMNLMSCHGFSRDTHLTTIPTCHSKLISYYISKGF